MSDKTPGDKATITCKDNDTLKGKLFTYKEHKDGLYWGMVDGINSLGKMLWFKPNELEWIAND